MSNQKLLPCHKCGTDEFLAVYTYDSGWKHVECNKCFYLGPGCGSKKQAIIEHNKHCRSMPPPPALSSNHETDQGDA